MFSNPNKKEINKNNHISIYCIFIQLYGKPLRFIIFYDGVHSILYSQTPCLNMRPGSHWEAVFVDVGKHLRVKLSWTGACANATGWFLLLPFIGYIYSTDNVPHCCIPMHVCDALWWDPPPLSLFIRTSPVCLLLLYHWQCLCTCISIHTCSKHNGKDGYDVYTKIQCKVYTCQQRTIDAMTIDKHLI